VFACSHVYVSSHTFPGPSVMNSGAMTRTSTKSAKRGAKRRKKRC
jgi:hypothetical protein